mmetsp:Transcript_8857/g.22932  ORF Transcript_8857/g.22932 Transcript_8857/m.22932 type:complete len:232 (-) Transcript_8857:3380-4075(-)
MIRHQTSFFYALLPLRHGTCCVDVGALAIRAGLVLQKFELERLLVEEVPARSANSHRNLRDHSPVKTYGQQGRILAKVDHVDLLWPQVRERLAIDADGLVWLSRHEHARRVDHLLHKEVGSTIVAAHRAVIKRKRLRASPRVFPPAVVGLLRAMWLLCDQLHCFLDGDAGLWLEFHEGQNLEAQERANKRVPAVDAAIAVRSQQRVRRHAPIADWKEFVQVVVRFGPDGEA